MSARPEHTTADRADRLQAGMLMHWQRPLLSEPPPEDGWRVVSRVESGEQGVLVVFDDGDTAFVPANQLMLLGWGG